MTMQRSANRHADDRLPKKALYTHSRAPQSKNRSILEAHPPCHLPATHEPATQPGACGLPDHVGRWFVFSAIRIWIAIRPCVQYG